MRKLILIIMCILMVGTVSAAVTRTINGNSITITIDSVEDFGMILGETIPIGYTPTGISSSVLGLQGTSSGKWTAGTRLYEIVIATDNVNPASITYGVSGSGSATIIGSYESNELGSGAITGDSQLGSGPCTDECSSGQTGCIDINTRWYCELQGDNCYDRTSVDCNTGYSCSNGICIQDTCVDTTWTPDPSTICSGQSFTQTSNCGNTRSATGTKTCIGSIERTIDGNSVTLTISSEEPSYGVIVGETIPIGYTPTGISSSVLGLQGTSSGKWTAGTRLYEIVIATDNVNPASITYGVSGSGSGTITGSYESNELGSGTVTGDSQLGSGPCTDTCDSLGLECGTWSICDVDEDCETCPSGETCSTEGVCETEEEEEETCSTDDDCEFWEKCESNKCEINTNMIVIGIILAFVWNMMR